VQSHYKGCAKKQNSVRIQFLSRVSILTRDIDIANLSVCLSVRNVPVSDKNGLTYRHSFFISFTSVKHFHKIPTMSPLRGAKYRWGIKNLQFSTNKSLYLTSVEDIAIVTMEGE